MLRVVTLVSFAAFLLGRPQVIKDPHPTADAKRQPPKDGKQPIPPTHIVIDPPLPTTLPAEPKADKTEHATPEGPLPRFFRPEWVIVYITAPYVLVAWWTLKAIKEQATSLKQQVSDASVANAANSKSALETLAALRRQAEIMDRQIEESKKSADESTAVAVKAADAAFKSSNETRRSVEFLVNSERAWVLATPVDLFPPNIAPATATRVNSFAFTLTNAGRTVARLTGPYRTKFQLVPMGEGLPELPDYGPLWEVFQARELPIHGRVVAPHQKDIMSVGWWDKQLTDEQFSQIETGRDRLYFYASLKYFDFAEQERELQFCYVYVPKGDNRAAKWELGGPRSYNTHT